MNYDEAKKKVQENFMQATKEIINWEDFSSAETMVVCYAIADAFRTGWDGGSSEGLSIGLNAHRHFVEDE